MTPRDSLAYRSPSFLLWLQRFSCANRPRGPWKPRFSRRGDPPADILTLFGVRVFILYSRDNPWPIQASGADVIPSPYGDLSQRDDPDDRRDKNSPGNIYPERDVLGRWRGRRRGSRLRRLGLAEHWRLLPRRRRKRPIQRCKHLVRVVPQSRSGGLHRSPIRIRRRGEEIQDSIRP